MMYEDDGSLEILHKKVNEFREWLESIGIIPDALQLDLMARSPEAAENPAQGLQDGSTMAVVSGSLRFNPKIALSDRVIDPEAWELTQQMREDLPTEQEIAIEEAKRQLKKDLNDGFEED